MNEPEYDQWALLPPEERQRLIAAVLSSGSLDKQNDMLQSEIEEAVAGQAIHPQQHFSALGGALGGLNDSLREIGGSLHEFGARKKQQALQPKLEAAHREYLQGLLGGGPSAPARARFAPPLQDPNPEGYGNT